MLSPIGCINVVLGGKPTPLHLKDRGKRLTETRLARFESDLGYRLPDDYREFLLRYNGGTSLIGDTIAYVGERAPPFDPGPELRDFYSLGAEEEYRQLRLPAEHTWQLPPHLLPFASDSFGNEIALDLSRSPTPVVFLDHEQTEEGYCGTEVAASFTDVLMLVKTIDERNSELEVEEKEEREQRKAERLSLLNDSWPQWFREGAEKVAARVPDLPARFRTLCLTMFDEHRILRVTEGDRAMLFLDVSAWMRQSQSVVPPLYPGSIDDVGARWSRSEQGEIGAVYYAWGFAAKWRADREARGWARQQGYFFNLTEEGIEAVIGAIADYAPHASGT